MQVDYSKSKRPSPDFWWTLLSNNQVTIPSENVREHFADLYPKNAFKLSKKNGVTRTRWMVRKYGKCSTVEDIESAIEKRGLTSLEAIELFYEKYERCHDNLVRTGYALGVVEMLVHYISYHCVSLLQSS